jgi:hypothetical protein
MKKSSRIKQILSVALVSVLAATVMPSTASANGEYYDYDDDVVTVEVDLGDGGGGDTGCVGISTLDLPDNTLRARFDELELGNANPTVGDLLNWAVGDEYYGRDFDQNDFQDYLYDLDEWLGDSTYTLNPEDATLGTLISISYQVDRGSGNAYLAEDTNQDGIIDVTDVPDYLKENRRSYVTDSFQVSFDANDCLDSEDMGLLLSTRGYVKRLNEAESSGDVYRWDIADVEGGFSSTSSVNRGEAHLRLPTALLGGLVSIPRKAATTVEILGDGEIGGSPFWNWSPISFGDSGQPQMRAVMKVFGANPTGKYQTKFYYLLEVGDEQYFDGLYWFLDELVDELVDDYEFLP